MSDILGRLKDAMFWLDQVNQERLGKMQGTFLHKSKNELMQAVIQLEREDHERVFGKSPFVPDDDC